MEEGERLFWDVLAVIAFVAAISIAADIMKHPGLQVYLLQLMPGCL